jgi:hypothetical protein
MPIFLKVLIRFEIVRASESMVAPPLGTGIRWLYDGSMYPWPFGEFDYVMDDALNIAMDYLIRTGQAVKFRDAQAKAAMAIAVALRGEEPIAIVQLGDPSCGTGSTIEDRLAFP